MAMKILALDGLNDSKLCKLMNSLLQTIPGVDYANIDYLSQKLTLQLSGRDTAKTIAKVTQMIKENMPGVSIKLTEVSEIAEEQKKKHTESGMHLDLAKALTTLMKEDENQDVVSEQGGQAGAEEKNTTVEDDIAEYNREKLIDPDEDISEENYEDSLQEDAEEGSEEPDETEDELEEEDQEEELEGDTNEAEEVVSFLQMIFSKLSKETVIHINCVLGALILFFVSLFFPQDSIASYVLSIISFITLSVFAFLASPEKYRAVSFTSALITVAASAAMFFSGGRIMASIALLLYHATFFVVLFLYNKFSDTVGNLIKLNPKTLLKYHDGVAVAASFDEVWSGDEIIMEKGDTIPFDAIVTNGTGLIDDSLLTGKTAPTEVADGGYISCGSLVLKSDNMRIGMVGLQENSIAAVINKTIDNDEPKKTNLSQSSHRFTVMFILISLMVIIGATMFFIITDNIDKCVYFLPVALMLLSPVGTSSAVEAIQKSALVKSVRQGIIVVSSRILEELSAVKTVVTGFGGVLTKNVIKVVAVIPAEDIDEEDLVQAAAYAEFKTEHPISHAIVDYYVTRYKKQIVSSHVAFCEVSSCGVKAMAEARIIGVGNERYMNENSVDVPYNETGKFCVYVSKYGDYMGTIILHDEKRDGIQKIGKGLKYLGIQKVVLLTGRDDILAEATGKKCGYDTIYSDKDASEKTNSLIYETNIAESPNSIVFAGDSDDAEAFAGVCSGIAMGENALNSMFYAAKAIIPSGEPKKLISFLRICKETRFLAWCCVGGCFAVKLALLITAILGGLPFVAAAVANSALMIAQALCAYLNSRKSN